MKRKRERFRKNKINKKSSSRVGNNKANLVIKLLSRGKGIRYENRIRKELEKEKK